MKYKVGDKVKIKSREWYEENKSKITKRVVSPEYNYAFIDRMSVFCGQVFTIEQIFEKGIKEEDCYVLKDSPFYWQDYMFEDNNQLEFEF